MAMSQGYGASARTAGGRPATGAFRSGLRLLLMLCLAGIGIGIGLRQLGDGSLASLSQSVTGMIFVEQDLLWFALCLIITGYVGWAMTRPLPRSVANWVERNIPDTIQPRRHLLMIVLSVLVIAAAGAILFNHAEVFEGERATAFQAEIFRQGTLVAPVPDDWADLAEGLNPSVATLDRDNGVWKPAAGPLLAAIRAAFDTIALGPLTNPVFAALSLLLMAAIARRLWADHVELPILAAGLLATSPQFLMDGLSGSAWSAQLCLNLAWLWLFLRDDRLGHVSAALVGLIAAGLQHIHVHALFVLPFLLMLVRDRRWLLAGLYAVIYTSGHLFWLNWHGVAVATTLGSGMEPVLAALGAAGHSGLSPAWPSGAGIALTGLSLLRLLGWTNLIVIPLMIVALRPWSKLPVTFRLLAIGILIALLSGLVLSPDHQDGWGHGPLHGHLGSLVLLACFGWVRLATGKPHLRADLNRALGLCCAAMLLIAIPLRAFQVERVASSTAASYRHVQGIDADVVLVDLPGIWFAAELVRNDPFLRNRPKVIGLQLLTPDQVRALCDSQSIAVVDYHDLAQFGVRPFAVRPGGPFAVSAPDRDLRAIATGPRCNSS